MRGSPPRATPSAELAPLEFPDEESWDLPEARPPQPGEAPAPGATTGRPPVSRRRGPEKERAATTAEGEEAEDESGELYRRRPGGPSLLDVPPPQLDSDGDDEFLDVAPDQPAPSGTLQDAALVWLHDRSRAVEFDCGNLPLCVGDRVVVERDQGLGLGTVARPCRRAMAREPLRRLIRTLDANDLRQDARNRMREREAFEYCRGRINQRSLPMKLIRVEYLHGGNKAIFYFAAESRVDFRDLVKDLAQRLHTRIVMRQVGVRDEAKMTGGIGSCGCELCCAVWLPDFDPVSIRMAKDQNLVLNPQKVSGQCGRLKCCLTYEQKQYQEARRMLPKPGRRVVTPDGEGKVQDLDVLRQLVRVLRDDGTMQTYPAAQVQARTTPQAPEPADEQ